jgi:hypothetical protein
MKIRIANPLITLTILAAAFACGSDSTDNAGNNSAAGAKATAGGSGGRSGADSQAHAGTSGGACSAFGLPCSSSFDCCSGLCDNASHVCASQINLCQQAGLACSASTDCCSMTCIDRLCGAEQCVSDQGACSADGQCCSQTCGAGACQPLNLACRTAGNACSANDECCSKLCKSGVCAVGSSYCIQGGDVCARASDCCSGICTVQAGSTVGTCGAPMATPANCDGVEGTVCGDCGGCCSRLCAPYGPTGVKICQPASGCRVVGELCLEDKDCCGGAPNSDLPGAGNGSCDRSDGGIVGRCRNVQSCSPQGNICHYKDYTCAISSAPNKCCDGVGNSGVCQLDTLGVPRCNGLGTSCRLAGEQCALADDCCDHVPCVRDTQGVLRCNADGPCMNRGGACTINADCCPGSICLRPEGSTSGSCGTPATEGTGGTSGAGGAALTAGAAGIAGSTSIEQGGSPWCSEYGQICKTASDCCASIPCTQGTCFQPIL